MEWISVKDTTPTVSERYGNIRVIACWGDHPENVAEKTYCRRMVRGKEVFRFENAYGGICNMPITHWMPLPEPPTPSPPSFP